MQHMRIAITADTHIHDWRTYSHLDSDGIPERLKKFSSFAEDIIKLKPDVVIIAGDLCESANPRPMVLSYTKQFLDILSEKSEVYVLSGNHDFDVFSKSNANIHSVVAPLSGKCKYITTDTKVDIGGISVFFQAFGNISYEQCDLFIGHNVVDGASDVLGHTYDYGYSSSKLSKCCGHAFIGHIHKKQTLNDNIIIPGGFPNTFKDDPDFGIWIYNTGSKTIEYHDIEELRPRYYDRFQRVDDVDQLKQATDRVHLKLKPKATLNKKIKDNKKVYIDIKPLAFDALEMSEVPDMNMARDMLVSIFEDASLNSRERKTIPEIKLQHISIQNFLSIANFDMDISNLSKITAVIGKNGSGKSTLLESICYGLFGECTKEIPVSALVNHNNDSNHLEVRIKFQVNGRNYEIQRGRKGGPYCKMIVEGEPYTSRAKDIQEDINALLGFTVFEFKMLSYFSVDNSVLFNTLTKTQKNQFLSKLMDFSDFDALEDSAKKLQKKLQLEHSEQTGKISAIQSNISRLKGQLQQEDFSQIIQDKEQRLADNKLKLTTYVETLQKLQDSYAQYDLDALRSEVDSFHKEEVNLNGLLSETNGRLNQSNVDMRRLNSDKESLKDSLKKGICPTCKQPLSDETLINEKISEIQVKIDALQPIITGLSEQSKKISNELYTLRESAQGSQLKLRESEVLRGRIDTGKNMISQMEKQIMQDTSAINELKTRDVSKQNAYILNEISILDREIVDVQNSMSDIQTKLNVSALFVNKFFKATGILMGRLNENLVQIFQEELDSISEIPIRVKSDLSFEIKFGNIFIGYNGLSKGQSRLIDIITLIALNNIFSKIYGLENGLCGIWMNDELFSYFDNEYIEKAFALLDNMAIDKIMIISHDKELVSKIDSVLRAELDEFGNTNFTRI